VNNVPLGLTLVVVGLVTVASALNKTTGSMIGGLVYGDAGMKAATGATVTPPAPITQDQLDKAAADPNTPRAGIVPIIPGAGIPEITVPIIPSNMLG